MTELAQDTKNQREHQDELLYAIDRTTHAARALPIFIFTSIATGIMATLLFILSTMVRATCQAGDCGGGFFLGAAWIVGLGGALTGLILGVHELSKSKVFEA
jgi:hypothetical protein